MVEVQAKKPEEGMTLQEFLAWAKNQFTQQEYSLSNIEEVLDVLASETYITYSGAQAGDGLPSDSFFVQKYMAGNSPSRLRMPRNRAELELAMMDSLTNLGEESPEYALRLAGQFSQVQFVSGTVQGKLETLMRHLREEIQKNNKKKLTAALEAPAPTRTGRHYRRALTAQEKNDLAMPPADNPNVGPGD